MTNKDRSAIINTTKEIRRSVQWTVYHRLQFNTSVVRRVAVPVTRAFKNNWEWPGRIERKQIGEYERSRGKNQDSTLADVLKGKEVPPLFKIQRCVKKHRILEYKDRSEYEIRKEDFISEKVHRNNQNHLESPIFYIIIEEQLNKNTKCIFSQNWGCIFLTSAISYATLL